MDRHSLVDYTHYVTLLFGYELGCHGNRLTKTFKYNFWPQPIGNHFPWVRHSDNNMFVYSLTLALWPYIYLIWITRDTWYILWQMLQLLSYIFTLWFWPWHWPRLPTTLSTTCLFSQPLWHQFHQCYICVPWNTLTV